MKAGAIRAPADVTGAALRRVPPKLRPAVIVVAIAIVGWLILRPSPTSDSYWALIWGRDILDGHLPQVDVAGAPSAHPLAVGVGAVVGVFGREAAVDVFNWLVLLSFGATLLGMFRLGQILFGIPVACVAVAATLCNFTLVNLVIFSSLDMTAYALTVWAAVAVASRPLRGVAPLVLVGIAGLQRPEVWILSAAYWLYLAIVLRKTDLRRVVALTVLAGAPLACWVGFDLVVTSQFGSSLDEIQSVAADIRKVEDAPLRDQIDVAVPPTFRVPFIFVALVGLGLAALMRAREAILPAAIGVLGIVAIGVYAMADIIIVSRFLVVSALMCALFVGYAVMGGIGTSGTIGRAWRLAGILGAGVVLVVGARQVDGVQDVRQGLGDDARASADEFNGLVDQPRVAHVLDSCTPVWMQAQDAATMYFGAIDPEDDEPALTVPPLGGRVGRRPDRGALLGGLPPLGLPQAASNYRLVVPAGFSRVGTSGRWTVYERGC